MQLHAEAGGGVGQFYAATVGLQHQVGQHQPQTAEATAGGVVVLLQGLAQVGQGVGGAAVAVVVQVQCLYSIGCGGSRVDANLRGPVLARVVEQVHQHGGQQVGVGVQHGVFFGEDFETITVRPRCQQHRQGHGLPLWFGAAAEHGEQGLHDAAQALAGLPGAAQAGLQCHGGFFDGDGQLGIDTRQGCAQGVRRVCGESAFAAKALCQALPHFAHGLDDGFEFGAFGVGQIGGGLQWVVVLHRLRQALQRLQLLTQAQAQQQRGHASCQHRTDQGVEQRFGARVVAFAFALGHQQKARGAVLETQGHNAPFTVGAVAGVCNRLELQCRGGGFVRTAQHLAALAVDDLPDQVFFVFGVGLVGVIVVRCAGVGQHVVDDFSRFPQALIHQFVDFVPDHPPHHHTHQHARAQRHPQQRAGDAVADGGQRWNVWVHHSGAGTR